MQTQDNPKNVSPYPQPIGGFRENQLLHGTQEEIDYLPGTSMRIWYTYLDTCYPLHWHNALEIVVCEKKHYTIEAEGNIYIIQPGDILLIPGRVTHALTPAKGCNGFVYLINQDIFSFIKSASRLMPLLSHPIHITEAGQPTLYVSISTLLTQMREDYFSANDLRELLIFSRALVMAEQLLHAGFDENKAQHNRCDKRKEYNDRFKKIISYMNHHYAENLTIDAVAKRFGLSKYYFSRLFLQYTNHTFCDYLTLRRIRAAELLMANQNLSITEIAFQAGFSNLSTFSRAFHKYKNCTPSEYRRIYVMGY